MSGGTFNYDQYKIAAIADTIEHNIANQGKTDEDGFSYEVLSPEVQAAFQRAIICLREAHIYAHRIDYLLAGDDSVGTFLKRLKEDLAEVRCIPLTSIPNWREIGAQGVVDYMLDKRATTLVNNLGSGIEYGIDDIEDSYEFFLKYVDNALHPPEDRR
jgi:hypothetical protein